MGAFGYSIRSDMSNHGEEETWKRARRPTAPEGERGLNPVRESENVNLGPFKKQSAPPTRNRGDVT